MKRQERARAHFICSPARALCRILDDIVADQADERVVHRANEVGGKKANGALIVAFRQRALGHIKEREREKK